MANELIKLGYRVSRQVGVPMAYKEIEYDIGFRMDLMVNELMIVEVKSVETLHEVHFTSANKSAFICVKYVI